MIVLGVVTILWILYYFNIKVETNGIKEDQMPELWEDDSGIDCFKQQ